MRQAALRFSPAQLLAQHLICLGVDLLLIGCAQFALMLHLGSASLGIPRVAGVRHRVFALFRQSEFFARLGLLFRCCEFCHYTTLPPKSSSTQGANVSLTTCDSKWRSRDSPARG